MFVDKPLFIKKLHLHGFKAFGDPTTLDLQPGIVAFAGPNGCGKSNLIDAIRWVTGEHRSTDLRGARLQDLIFHGSSSSRQSNYAEVTITFDNSQKIIPSSFPEITVSRRVYRSGESECFINGTACRLKDINDLLGGIVSRSGYCIVAQGRVGEIASSTPEAKRKIIEEVAGVDKFREKNREYERRIEQSKQNLKRVSDILKTITTQEKNLRKQAEECEEFFQLKKKLRELEIKKSICELWSLEEQKDHIHEVYLKLRHEKKQSADLIEQLHQEKKDTLEAIAAIQKSISQLEKRQIESSSEESVRAERANLRMKLTTLNQDQLQKVEKEMEIINGQIKSNLEHLKGIEDKKAILSNELKMISKKMAEIEKSKKELSEKLEELKNDQAKKKEAIDTTHAVIQKDRKEMENVTEVILSKLRRVAGHDFFSHLDEDKKVEEIKAEEEKLVALADELLAINDFSLGNVEKIKAIIGNLNGKLKSFLKSNDDLQKSLNHELKGFEEVLNEYEKRKELTDKVGKNELLIENLNREIDANQQAQEEISKKIYAITEEIYQINIDQQSVSAQEKEVHFSLQKFQEELSELNEKKEKTHLEQEKWLEEIKKIKLEEEALAEEKKTGVSNEKKIKEELEGKKQEEQAMRRSLEKIEKAIEEQSRNNHQIGEKVNQQHNKVELLKNDIVHLQKNVQSLYQVDLLEESKNASELRSSYQNEMGELKKNISSLQSEMEQKGKINPLAFDEHQKVKKQMEELVGEKNDAEKSMLDLKKLSDSLVEDSSQTFLECFKKVQEAFSAIIAELFSDGKGQLLLQDSEQPLENGVEIKVEPKGKRSQKTELFSGGEKTLISVAFLFSLFLAKRTPFCIFDEIDAALDNENTLRFIKMLKKYERETQFIIVSHNQDTFSIVDYVYGVSMKEGISNVFSLKMPTENY